MADSPPNNPEDGNIVYLWKIPVDRSYVKSLDSLLKVIAAVSVYVESIEIELNIIRIFAQK